MLQTQEELLELGWNDFFQQALDPNLVPARVGIEQRGRWARLSLRGGEARRGPPAEGRSPLDDWLVASGAIKRGPPEARPAIGDWVAVDPEGRIQAVLPRRAMLCRQAAGGRTHPQIVAANVDRVFVVTSANHDLSARRIERYVTAIHGGGGAPAIILSKLDLCADPRPIL